jgi:hypothetical protein
VPSRIHFLHRPSRIKRSNDAGATFVVDGGWTAV